MGSGSEIFPMYPDLDLNITNFKTKNKLAKEKKMSKKLFVKFKHFIFQTVLYNVKYRVE